MSDIHKFQYEKRDLPNCPCSSWPFSPAIILNFTTASAPNSRNEHCIKTHSRHLKSFAVIRRELLHILSPLPPLPGTLTKALLPTDKGSHWADLWTPQRLMVISSQLSLLRTQPRPAVWPSGSLIYQSSSPLNSPPQLLLFPILFIWEEIAPTPFPQDEQSTLYPIPFCLLSFSPTPFCPHLTRLPKFHRSSQPLIWRN